jgi:hypothetical protein
MCNSSLGVRKNTSSIYFSYNLLIFICPFILKKKIEKKMCYVFAKFELNCNCNLHFISLLKGLNISLCQ